MQNLLDWNFQCCWLMRPTELCPCAGWFFACMFPMKVSMKSLSESFCLDGGMVDAGSKTSTVRENKTIKEYCRSRMEEMQRLRQRVTTKVLLQFRMCFQETTERPLVCFEISWHKKSPLYLNKSQCKRIQRKTRKVPSETV